MRDGQLAWGRAAGWLQGSAPRSALGLVLGWPWGPPGGLEACPWVCMLLWERGHQKFGAALRAGSLLTPATLRSEGRRRGKEARHAAWRGLAALREQAQVAGAVPRGFLRGTTHLSFAQHPSRV